MPDDKVRLGGMALRNGVLVHGPTSWGCAIRTQEGAIKIASGRKRLAAARIGRHWLRGPARIVEPFAVLPLLKRALPEAELPFEGRGAAASLVAVKLAIGGVRRTHIRETSKELLESAFSVAPVLMTLRGGELTAYHGAEHIVIGSYEHGEPRAKEHERCGTHLWGPLLATTTAGNLLASRLPPRQRPLGRIAASAVAIGASTKLFSWVVSNPDRRLARMLSRPGHELQARLTTSEPNDEQIEVAEAALAACLELEEG